MATRDIDLIGTTLGNYKLTGMLGRGGMATVYRAMDTALKRDVALKVLSSQLSEEHDFIKRFQREAQAAAQLNHPNIVNVFSIGEDQGYHFFAMEYIKGKALSEIKRDEGKLAPKRAVSIIKAVADALGDAHRAGLVHRDIKPSNIMISKEGRVKVTDFGIAYLLNAQTKLTRDGSIIGTPEYLSPEQCEGKTVDQRSDIYSLGVTLYELLTGKTPYEADTPVSMIMKIVKGDFRPIKDLSPDIPTALQKIVEKMMAIDLSQRYADADEVIAALEQFEMETTGMTSSDMKTPRTRFDEKVPGNVSTDTPGTRVESPTDGTRLESNSPGTVMESPAPAGTRVETGTPGTVVENNASPTITYQELESAKNPIPEKKKGKSQGLIAAAILILLVGGAIAIKLLVLDKRGTSTNSLPTASGGSMGLATTQNQNGNPNLPADLANNTTNGQGNLDVTLSNGNQTPSDSPDSNGNTTGNSNGNTGTVENPNSSSPTKTTSSSNTRGFSTGTPSAESPATSSPSRTNINRNMSTVALANRQTTSMEPAAPSLPPAKTCAITINGSRDSDFIGSYAEEILSRRKIQVVDSDGNIASSARHQMTISVANLGTEELNYYGRSSTQTTIRITLKVIDPRTRKVVAGPVNKEVSYTNLNRQDNIKEALREMISKVQSALENN